MKKVISILLVAIMICTFAGCGKTAAGNSSAAESSATPSNTAPTSSASDEPEASPSSTAADDSLKRVLDSGKLRVGAEGNWVPFVYNDTEDDGKLEVEVAEEVAKRLGVTVEWSIANKWDGVIGGLQAKRYDAIFCGVSKNNLESAENLIGSAPYNESNIVLVTAKDNDEIKDWTDLKGKLSANALTSDYGRIAQKYGAECTNASLEQAMELMVQHRVDCSVNSQIAIMNYMEKKPDMPVKIAKLYEPENREDLYSYAAFNKEDVSLCNAVSEKITEMIKDNTCYDLAVKYFGNVIADSIELFK